jgi:shikimate kinase
MVLKRVGNDPNRPLLQAPDRLERIRALLAKRAPAYDSIPIQIETDGLTPEQAAVLVLERFRAVQSSSS